MISSSNINIPGPGDQTIVQEGGDEEEKEEEEMVMAIPQTGRARSRTRNRAQPGLRRVAPTLPPATGQKIERILPNGDFYTGSFLGKAPHGPGKYLWSDGCMYEGEWRRGKANGKGRFSWPSGATYEGEFKAGKMDGYGTFTGTDGDTYKGMWRADKKHGDGEKRYANGDFYQGSWKNNLQDGEGRYVWSNGNVYVGDWRAGVISGEGILIWANGNRYEGYWENGVPRGAGFFTRADGSTYAGNWGNGFVENNENVHCGRGDEEGVSKKGLSADAVGMCSMSERGVNFPRICIWEDDEEGGDITCDIIDNAEVSKLCKDAINNPPRGVGYRNRLGFGARRQRNCHSQSPSPRPSWLGGSDEIKKPGQTISKGHKNYELMLNLQLGIRHSVGKHGSKGRALKPSDFDPREKYWTRFPPEGSRSTPPHQSVDFRWKDYCPMVFRHLRELFEIDPADYMLAICGNDALREFSSPGKSGSSFYLTQDDRFMIKTVKKSDVKVLIKMLPSYYRHVSKYRNTLVTKFFGLHCVKPIGGLKTRFIVMGNLFHSDYRIHRRFDIKGSSHGRSTDKNEREIDETTTLKDLDLNMVFWLQHSWFEELMRQVDRDCEFLEAEKIMDYSLLIGLHFCDDLSNDVRVSSCTDSGNHEELTDEERRRPPPPPIRLGANMPAQAERVVRIDFVDQQQQLQLQGSSVRSSNNNNNYSSHGIPRRQGTANGNGNGTGTGTVTRRGTTPPPRRGGTTSTSLVRFNSDGYREVYNVILHFGIIDILQDYDISKRIEHAYKSLQVDPTSISAVDPKLYSKRFRDFLHKIFMED